MTTTGSNMAERTTTNPYPGPRPFRSGETIYGRDQEITQLFYLLSAERIVVLHSPSGAGKSSLIQAGLVPRLKQERFDVWHSIRLSTSSNAKARNRFVSSAILSLEEGLPSKRRREFEQIADQTLAQYIAECPRRPGAPPWILLIFDQFEEILTLDPIDIEAKQEFFQQVGETLKNPNIWALFALREDYLAALDPYRDFVPTRLSNTFRIDLLTVEAGLEAITKPAHDAGPEFAVQAARQLVDDLATVSVQQPDGHFSQVPGRFVEPVQLQVVCRRLWDELPADAQTIGVEHLHASGNVGMALAAYYGQCVAEIAGGDVSYERRLREWFSERLITPGGIRGQVLREQDQSGGLDTGSVSRLLDTHLVRSEQRIGATWYELAHDRLVAPVRNSNATWFDKNLHPMQRQAALWEREGKPDRLLLRGQYLKEAEGWVLDNAVLLIEKDLLARSAKQRMAERRNKWMIATLFIGLLGILGYVTWSGYQTKKLYNRTKADNYAFISSRLSNEGDITRSLRVAQAAYDIDPAAVPPSVAQVLADAYIKASKDKFAVYKNILRHEAEVTAAVFSPDGSKIVTATGDGTATLWDKNGTLIKEMKQGEWIRNLAFTHDGKRIIIVGDGHLVKMWDAGGNYIKDLIGHGCHPKFKTMCSVHKVAIAPDDQTIVTVSTDQLAIMWNYEGEKINKLDEYSKVGGWLTTVAFSPDGKYFATAGEDGDLPVQLYNAKGGHIPSLNEDHCTEPQEQHWKCGIFDVAFSPDGKFLLTASADKAIKMYDLKGNLLKTLTNHTARVNSVVFSHDGQFFLSASDDGTAILWNHNGTMKQAFKGHSGAVTKALFSPNGKYIATVGIDNTAKLWDLDGHIIATYAGHKSRISSVNFSPHGEYILTTSTDRKAMLWSVRPIIQSSILKHDNEVISAHFLPDGNRILTASNDMTVRLWKADVTTEPLKTYAKLFGPDRYGNRRIYSLDISPDGNRFITTGTDYTVRIWEVETGRVFKDWKDSRDHCNSTGWCGINNARYSFDGKYIVTLDFIGVVKIFDSEGSFLKSIQEAKACGIAVSHDDTLIATGSCDDGTIKLWDFNTGKLRKTLTGHTQAVCCLDFSKEGDLIVSGSADHTIKLWDLQGNIVQDIDAHYDEVTSVEFSPKTKHILSSSKDKTAKIWDMNGKLVKSMNAHNEWLRSAHFWTNGNKVVTASADKTALIWLGSHSIYDWLSHADMYQLTSKDLQELRLDDDE